MPSAITRITLYAVLLFLGVNLDNAWDFMSQFDVITVLALATLLVAIVTAGLIVAQLVVMLRQHRG